MSITKTNALECGNIFAESSVVTFDNDLNLVGNIIFNTTPSNNDVLTYTGGKWQAAAAGGGSVTLVMDNNATPKYPENATEGVWFGTDTKGNTGGVSCVTIGPNAKTTTASSIAIGRFAQATTSTYAIAIGSGTSASTSANATGSASIAIGQDSLSNNSKTIAIGYRSLASGDHSIAIGGARYSYGLYYGAVASGSASVAISTLNGLTGFSNYGRALGTRSVGIGAFGYLKANYGIAIGALAHVYDASHTNSISIGRATYSRGVNSISIGASSEAQGYAVALGRSAFAYATDAIAIGRSSESTASGAIGIGRDADSTSAGSIAIGKFAQATTGTYAIAIGGGSSATLSANVTGADGIAIGRDSLASSSGSVAIGQGITANQTNGFFMKHRGPGAYTVNSAGFIAGTNELVEITSSRRFKENIRDLEEVSNVFDTFRPVRYNAKPGHGDDREHIGLIAEEVEEIFPEFITYNQEGLVTGILMDRIVAVTIKEMQAMRKREVERDVKDAERDAKDAERDILIQQLQEEIALLKK